MDKFGFTRRGIVQIGTAVAAGGMLGAKAGAMPASSIAVDYDPRTTSAGLVKLEAYADGRMTPWWYYGTIYNIREREKPQPLFKFEGCEVYQVTPRADGSAICDSRTLTFFRDFESDAWMDEYRNPFTGTTNPIRPNILTGRTLFPADGSPPRMLEKSKTSELAPEGYADTDPDQPIGHYEWVIAGDMILRKGDRTGGAIAQPAMEVQATMGDVAEFFDPNVIGMKARFSSTTFSPYLGWMDMREEPGHLAWHAAGLKLSGFAALPAEYAARAEAIKPGLLMAPFD